MLLDGSMMVASVLLISRISRTTVYTETIYEQHSFKLKISAIKKGIHMNVISERELGTTTTNCYAHLLELIAHSESFQVTLFINCAISVHKLWLYVK